MANKVILSLAAVFAALAVVATAQACGPQCRFRLCKLDGTGEPRRVGTNILLRAPKTSLTAYICRDFGNNQVVDRVMRTGEAVVDGVPISDVTDVTPAFKANHIRLYSVDFSKGLQGVGRQPSSGDQDAWLLTRRCMVLPIRNYDIRNTVTGEIKTIGTTDEKDCVSFASITQRLIIELAWNNSDDFDLTVKDPNGDTGLAANDNSVGRCEDPEPPLIGKETVIYEDPIPGTYKAQVRHFESCDGKTKTKWIVRVTLDGKTILTRKGKSNRGKNRKVGNIKFTVPAM